MDTFFKLFSSSAAAPAVKHHGLINHGATCYLNSVLQVLFMTPEFREAVNRFTDNNPGTEGFIDADLKDLFDDLQRGTTYTFKIINALKIDSVYEQRDAAEYFEKILNLTSPDAAKIFHGKQAHRTTCLKCSRVTDTDGPFCHLPFELQDSCSGNYSVVDGIEKYFQSSNFYGDNQMYCDKCDCKVDASSKYVIKHHPDVLVLLLKRFDFSYRYMSYVKIKCDVNVPYVLYIPEGQTYELYAVVDHFGDLRGGHYAATIRSQDDDDRWISFDDTRVTPLDRSLFTDKQNVSRFADAYLLFYRKKVVVAGIQEKINKPKKRSIIANTDENEPETKKQKLESDTEGQEENKTLLPNEDLKERKDPENKGPTEEVKPNINPDPGDSEASADRQDDRSDPPGGLRNEEIGTRINKDKKLSDSPEDMTFKDNNQDNQEEVTRSTHLEEPELTVVDQSRPEVSHDFNPGDREKVVFAACDTQDRSDADRLTMNTTDKLNQTENSDSHGHVMESKDENTYLISTEMFTQTEVTNSETSEQTETIPGAETLADKEDNMSEPPGGFRDEEIGTRIKEDKKPSDSPEDMTFKDNNQHNQDNQEEVTRSTHLEEPELTVVDQSRPEVSHDFNTGDREKVVSAACDTQDKEDNMSGPPGGFRDEETEGLERQHVQESSNTHTEDMRINNKDADDQQHKHSDEGQNERLVSCESSVECDRRGETSDPQEEFIHVKTEETRVQHEEEKSEKNTKTSNNDQKKDKTLLSSEDQDKDKDPENEGLTRTKEMIPDVNSKPGDSETSTVLPVHDTQNKVSEPLEGFIHEETGNSDRQEDKTYRDGDQEKDISPSSTGDLTEVKDPEEAEQTDNNQMTSGGKLDLKPGDSERSVHDKVNPAPRKITESVEVNDKTRSHEKKRLLDENTEDSQTTAVSSERTEQNMTTKDDDDEVNKRLLYDGGHLTMMDIEGGAERKPCIRQWKYIVMSILAVLLALILLIVVFTVRL